MTASVENDDTKRKKNETDGDHIDHRGARVLHQHLYLHGIFMKPQEQQKANTRLLVKLVFVVVGMFGFGFAMIPLYNVLCDITGINGKTGTLTADQAAQLDADENRTVTVEFVANLNQSLNWEFRPNVRKNAGASWKSLQHKFLCPKQNG